MPYLPDLTFAWPWLIVLLPVIWAVQRWVPSQPPAALYVPHALLWRRAAQQTSRSSYGVRRLLGLVAWTAFVLAVMRPTLPGPSVAQPLSGRQMMLIIDLSQSMSIADMTLNDRRANRLDVLKTVLREFIDRRTGDQIGLTVFGSEAYLVLPVSPDLRMVQTVVLDMHIGMAGARTAMGDGLGIGLAHLIDNPTEGDRTVILLSDGAQNEGNIQPADAAQWAADNRIRLYTIGFGATLSGTGLFNDLPRAATADIDEPTLIALAEATGGQYFRAESTQQLQDIYRTIDRLEPALGASQYLSPRIELFYWPAAFGLVLMAISQLLSHGIPRPTTTTPSAATEKKT